MKKKLFFGAIFCFAIVFGSYGQKCDAAVFLKKGSVLEYTSFNKKGKEDSKTIHKTIDITEEAGKFTADVTSTVIDKKGKEAITMDYQATCENGLFSIDMSRFFDAAQLQQYEGKDNFDFEIKGNALEFPGEMKPGTELNDGNFTVKVNSNNFTLITMSFDITNRKVVGTEKITTKAGTFDCQKVTFDFNSKAGIIKVRGSGVEWYLDNKVVVRSESYNKKGKLLGYSELTSMK